MAPHSDIPQKQPRMSEERKGVTMGGVLRLVVFLGIGFFFIY